MEAKRLSGILFALALIVAAIPANAGTATINWVAPTQYTNNQAIPAGTAITYRVYGGRQGQPKTAIGSTVALTYTHATAPNGETWCYAVTASVASVESAQTTEVCKAIPPLVPNPPTIVTVEVVAGINMTPLYRINADGSRGTALLGFVPVGTACAGPVVYRYRGRNYRRPADFSIVKWEATPPTMNAAAACT